MRLILPICIWTGISIAYYDGCLVEMMSLSLPSDSEDQKKISYEYCMLAMVFMGVGEVLGSFSIGYIIDKFGNKLACLIDGFIVVIMFVVTIIFLLS
jgi:hypothetical protein